MNGPYENLADAVVLQAVKDWRKATRTLKKRPQNEPAELMKDECERFFHSNWFEELADVDGEYVLCRLKKEAGLYDE